MKIFVIHHRDADGFGSAYALWEWMKNDHELDFHGAQYGEPLPEIPEGTSRVYVLDFSYPLDVCEQILSQGVDLVVIDHHITAEKELQGKPYAHIDTTKAGCQLTWEHFTSAPLPPILSYVADRDLWKFELSDSDKVNLYIASLPWDFEEWRGFSLATALAAGGAIHTFRQHQIDSTVKKALPITLKGTKDTAAVIVNCTANISEVGHALLEKHPQAEVAVMWQEITNKSKISYSLRSRKDGFDCSAYAKERGGGGHPCAAGFEEGL